MTAANALRSIAGVAAGCGLFLGALQFVPWLVENSAADSNPTLFVMVHVAVAAVAGVLAGFLTALIAGRRELPHTSPVGLFMVGVAVWAMRQQAVFRPGWYQLAIAGCGPVSAMVGGGIVALLRARKS